jgi:hypothetical protein
MGVQQEVTLHQNETVTLTFQEHFVGMWYTSETYYSEMNVFRKEHIKIKIYATKKLGTDTFVLQTEGRISHLDENLKAVIICANTFNIR